MANTSLPNYREYGNIINAAHKLTGSKAKTKEGAWRALREKHLYRVHGLGLKQKSGYYAIIDGVWCDRSMGRDDYYHAKWRSRAERGGEKIMRDLGLKTRWESIQSGGCDEWERNLYPQKRKLKRDGYGALYADTANYGGPTAERDITNSWIAAQNQLSAAQKCIRDIECRPDEHGGWAQYADFDKHNRGSCVNVDVYGTDGNLHVIQVRQFIRHYKNGFGNVKKTYFLIGYNENGNPFAHPVSAHKIHAAIKADPSPESPVRAAQAWIWGIEETRLGDVLRNGDTALIPAKTPPKTAIDITPESGMMRVIDSHWLYSRNIRRNGAIYAENPTLRHLKGQHPTVKGRGWYKVVVGNRADFHDFAKPTVD